MLVFQFQIISPISWSVFRACMDLDRPCPPVEQACAPEMLVSVSPVEYFYPLSSS